MLLFRHISEQICGGWTGGVVRLTRLPVTEKTTGSNPVRSASHRFVQKNFRELGSFLYKKTREYRVRVSSDLEQVKGVENDAGLQTMHRGFLEELSTALLRQYPWRTTRE